MDTRNKRPLNIFEAPLESWEQFCVIKMLGDLAEILQVEDLLHCSFVPLRNIARTTMPEEKFHAQFGLDFCVDMVETAEGKKRVQKAVNGFYPEAPKFFGASGSKNNDGYRRFGIKLRSNEDMRADYHRARPQHGRAARHRVAGNPARRLTPTAARLVLRARRSVSCARTPYTARALAAGSL